MTTPPSLMAAGSRITMIYHRHQKGVSRSIRPTVRPITGNDSLFPIICVTADEGQELENHQIKRATIPIGGNALNPNGWHTAHRGSPTSGRPVGRGVHLPLNKA